jgi:hypothetical protein
MSNIKTRLEDAAALLDSLSAIRGRPNPAHGVARQIVARELRELERDILADPGALAPLLDAGRRKRRRPERRDG